MSEHSFSYDNTTGRRPGRLWRATSALFPGVRRVQQQVQPYAEAWREDNLRAMHAGVRRWVVIGDSMSQGIGAASYDAGWVHQLAERLASSGRPVALVNLSATGARVPDVLEQQLPALRSLPAPRAGADLVTVMVGANDLMSRAHRDLLPGRFGALVDSLPPGSIVATLPQPRAAARAANRHLEGAVAAGRLRVVDLRVTGPRSWRGKLTTDWFHPNESGYAAIADAFEPVVRAAYDA